MLHRLSLATLFLSSLLIIGTPTAKADEVLELGRACVKELEDGYRSESFANCQHYFDYGGSDPHLLFKYARALRFNDYSAIERDEVKSTIFFRRAAQAGSMQGRIGLATALAYGIGTKKDVKQALEVIKPVITASDEAVCKGFGKLFPQPDNNCIGRKQLASIRNMARSSAARYLYSGLLGQTYYEEALNIIKTSEPGYPSPAYQAWERLSGTAGYGSSDVEKNMSVAVLFLQQAADQGSTEGLEDLIALYEKGEHIKKDPLQLAKYVEMLAETGDADAMLKLAHIYNDKRDFEPAFFWLMQSAEKGNAQAQMYVGRVYQKGDPDHNAKPDHAKAISWFKKAVDADNYPAKLFLWEMYQNKQWQSEDLELSLAVFQAASQKFDLKAQYNYASLVLTGLTGGSELEESLRVNNKKQALRFLYLSMLLDYPPSKELFSTVASNYSQYELESAKDWSLSVAKENNIPLETE